MELRLFQALEEEKRLPLCQFVMTSALDGSRRSTNIPTRANRASSA
jgi:hypothetical protein